MENKAVNNVSLTASAEKLSLVLYGDRHGRMKMENEATVSLAVSAFTFLFA